MTASLVFIITYAWVLSSDETGALVWLSDRARAVIKAHCHTPADPSGGGFALLREQPLNILEVVGLRASHGG